MTNWRQAGSWRSRLQMMNVHMLQLDDPDFWVGLDGEVAEQVEVLWEAYQDLHAEVSRQDRGRRTLQQKQRARRAVAKAVQEGSIHRADVCEHQGCGRDATEAHHDDYSKPLDVTWLCMLHHREQHRKDGL